MKVKSAEQYKALRKRELAKRQKRNRRNKRDEGTAATRFLNAVFGNPTFNAPPMTNEKRYQDITGILKERKAEGESDA